MLKVDVLTLEVRVGEGTAGRLERLVAGRRYGEPLADSVARILLTASDEIDITQAFLRDVPLDRFLDEVRAGMEKAVRAGFAPDSDFREKLIRSLLESGGDREEARSPSQPCS